MPRDDDRRVLEAIASLRRFLVATLDDLAASVASLTTADTAEKAAVDALIAFVGTLQPGTLTADQQAKLDAANAAVLAIGTQDTAETASATAAATPPPPATP
jgi:hypothetical protein